VTFLRAIVDQQLQEAFGEVGTMEPPLFPADAVDQPYEWNNNTIAIPRGMAVDFGLVEPTPQEAADMAATRAWARQWHADRHQRRAEWFSAVRDACYPDAVAMLDLHVPDDDIGDCEACTIDPYDARVPWPCATLLAAAEFVGIPEPEGI
jgi:hypothetical protein